MATTIAQPLLWDGSPIAVPCDGERNVQSRQSVLAMGQVSTLRISFLGRSTFTRVLPDGTEDAATWRFELRDKPGAGYSVLFATNSVTVDPVTKEIAVDCSGTYTVELADALGERPVASFPALLSGYNTDGKRAVSVAFPLSVANTTDEEAMPEEAESQLNIVLRLVERVDAIEELIPANASAQNKLATLADVAAAGGKFIVVQTLPSAESADRKAIYLVPRTTSEIGNIYDEYVVVEPTTGTYAWEKIGSTEIDLSAYRTAAAQDVIDAGKASTADATLTRSTTWTATGLPAGYSLVSATWISDEWIIRLTDDNGDVAPFPIAGHSTDTELTFTFDDSTVILKKSEILVLGSQSDKPLAPANDYALKSEIPSVPVKQVKRNGTALTPDSNGAVDVTVPTTAADVGAANQTTIAAAFTAKAYAVGDLATYNGLLYRCKSAYTATASSAKPDADSTHWEAAVVAVLLGNKTDKVADSTSGDLAAFDENGNLVDSGNQVSGSFGCSDLVVAGPGTLLDLHFDVGDNKWVFDGDMGARVEFPASFPSASGVFAFLQHVAPDFSTSGTYAEGALCTYNGALYRCTTAVTSAGDWTGPANWASATVEDVLAALRSALAGKADTSALAGKLDAVKRNLLDYTSGTTLAPGTAIYRSAFAADGTFPTITATAIPTAAAYYQFELELTVPSTVPSTITGPSGWTWIDGHGLPDPADLVGGETICISVRLDCTARTFLASVWRVA